jgi:outer membrane biosynthesis protein TonB
MCNGRLKAAALGVVLGLFGPAPALAAGKLRPATLTDLVVAMADANRQSLTQEEREILAGRSPEEVRDVYPELYEKIRARVKKWTDDWTRAALSKRNEMSPEDLDDAELAVAEVDAVLSPYFEQRGWPYRTISVVFLPQRLLASGNVMRLGMFIPFYPDAFFATFDLSLPTRLVLMHETLHFNEHGPYKGHLLTEGIGEEFARRLAAKHGLLTNKQLERWSTYEIERGVVRDIAERIMERSSLSEEAALDLLVEWLVTGDASRVERALGEDSWKRVVQASREAVHPRLEPPHAKPGWYLEPFVRIVHEALKASDPSQAKAGGATAKTLTRRHPLPEGLIEPRVEQMVRPKFPSIAKQLNETGRIVVSATVTSKGVVRVDGLDCYPDRPRQDCHALLRSVKNAVEQWRYVPARLGQEPVEASLRIGVDFDIVAGKPVVSVSEAGGAERERLDRPVCIRAVQPLFPPQARTQHTAGLLIARAELSGDGTVHRPIAVRSEPSGVFDESVLQAIPQWRYRKDWTDPTREHVLEFQIHFQHAPCVEAASLDVIGTDAEQVERAVVCTGGGDPFTIAR